MSSSNFAHLRRWQREALETWRRIPGSGAYLIRCTMGAGKTICGCAIAADALASGQIARIVVLVSSRRLRRDWQRQMEAWGIPLDPTFTGAGAVERANHGQSAVRQTINGQPCLGIVVSYYALPDLEQFVRYYVEEEPTLVICDEPHHVGELQRWGQAHNAAVAGAAYRLYLTATPFRSDGGKISGLTYTDGVADELYPFSYRDALRQGRLNPDDRCVTPIVTHPFDGDISWFEGNDDDRREITKRLSDGHVTKRAEQRRRHYALYPQGTWLSDALQAADGQLTVIRATHQDAAGIVWARDVEHATAISELLESITRERVLLVHSDVDEAADLIGEFATSNQRWIVAVRMVSEGVDIPRLRVGVVACAERTVLYFMQMAGRLMRWVPALNGIDQTGHLFVPAEPAMLALAASLEEDVAVALTETEEEADHQERDRRDQLQIDVGFLDSTSEYVGPVIGSEGLESILHVHAIALSKRQGRPYDDALLIVRDLYENGLLRLDSFRDDQPASNGHQPRDYEAELAETRSDLEALINTWAQVRCQAGNIAMHDTSGGWTGSYGRMVAKLKGKVNEHLGFKYKGADIPDLQRAQEWVREQTRTSRYAGSR